MSILRFFNENVTVRRLKPVDATKTAFQATATADGHIQELSPEARQSAGIVEERAWKAWFREDAPVHEGDQITDESGVVYHVREVTVKDYGINRHMEVILVEFNA